MLTTSETIALLSDALAKAQAEMKNAPLSKVNPHFRSKYADLPAVRDATLPALTKHGLAILQAPTVTGEGQFVLVTRLMHSSGEWIESSYPLPMGDKPQAIGSALTYARRYSWSAICGITADEDDDGQAAQDAPSQQQQRQPPKQQAPTRSAHPTTLKMIEEVNAKNSREELQALIASTRWNNAFGKLPDTDQQRLEELYKRRLTNLSESPFGGEEAA